MTKALLIGFGVAFALMGTAWAERLPIKAYTAADGLAHDRVTCVVSDSRGFLWFCTAQGLSRFDGHRFSTDVVPRVLPDAGINDFLETSRGVYWVATNGGGVQRINRSVHPNLAHSGGGQRGGQVETANGSRFTDFSVGDVPETNRVNVLYEDRGGRLWAGTDGGLFFLEDSVEPGGVSARSASDSLASRSCGTGLGHRRGSRRQSLDWHVVGIGAAPE